MRKKNLKIVGGEFVGDFRLQEFKQVEILQNFAAFA